MSSSEADEDDEGDDDWDVNIAQSIDVVLSSSEADEDDEDD
jgi:hypothetical protein